MAGISVIGSADGPTSIFLAGELGMSWLSLMGLIIVALLLLPNIIFTVPKQVTTGCYIKGWIDHVEKVTRITTMLLMIFQLGVSEEGFSSVLSFIIYFLGNIILLVAYWMIWILYKQKQTFSRRLILVEIPCIVYILCALTMQHWLLLISAVIFAVSHTHIQQKKMKLIIFEEDEEEENASESDPAE